VGRWGGGDEAGGEAEIRQQIRKGLRGGFELVTLFIDIMHAARRCMIPTSYAQG
jgi:hypothetical protein